MDIERLFKMSVLQRTRTGRQVCRFLEEDTECDQDLSLALIVGTFVVNVRVCVVFIIC